MAGPDYWEMFFEERYGAEIQNIRDFYPEVREISVPAGELFTFMGKDTFLLSLMGDPFEGYFDVWKGLNQCVGNEEFLDIFPNITGKVNEVIPLEKAMKNNKIKYFTTEAHVLIKKDNIQDIFNKIYMCDRCSWVLEGQQKPPKKCPNCDQNYNKKWEVDDQDIVDMTLLEIGDNTKDGNLITTKAYIYGLDTSGISMGQRVRFNCIKNTIKESKMWTSQLMVMGWESADQSWDEVNITKDFSEVNPIEYFEKLKESIAPSIVGYEDIKTSILLQAVMGGFWTAIDGTKTRRWVNILMAGDPGTAKSKLMEYTEMIWPKAVWGGGSRSSKAGLTVAMVDDPLLRGKKIPMAGTLVRASKGLALIDEMDKMETHDKKAIQSAMENGVVNVAMAGTQATFKSETSILAGCNPKDAFFDMQSKKHYDKIDMRDDVDMPPEIESRFDTYWIIRDIENKKRDIQIAQTLRTGGDDKGYIQPDEIMQYCALKRREPEPILPEELGKEMDEWYSEKREKHQGERMINPRVYNSIKRFTIAFAMFRGSKGIDGQPVATSSDFHEAKELYHRMLSNLAGFDTMDINPMYKNMTMKKEIIQVKIIEHIRTYDLTTEGIIELMADVGPDKIEDALELLQNKMNRIFKGNDGKWRMV